VTTKLGSEVGRGVVRTGLAQVGQLVTVMRLETFGRRATSDGWSGEVRDPCQTRPHSISRLSSLPMPISGRSAARDSDEEDDGQRRDGKPTGGDARCEPIRRLTLPPGHP
jgi:hypothetical protein